MPDLSQEALGESVRDQMLGLPRNELVAPLYVSRWEIRHGSLRGELTATIQTRFGGLGWERVWPVLWVHSFGVGTAWSDLLISGISSTLRRDLHA